MQRPLNLLCATAALAGAPAIGTTGAAEDMALTPARVPAKTKDNTPQ